MRRLRPTVLGADPTQTSEVVSGWASHCHVEPGLAAADLRFGQGMHLKRGKIIIALGKRLVHGRQRAERANYRLPGNEGTSFPEIFSFPIIKRSDATTMLFEALQKAGDTRATEVHMETDHSYNDHRIALQTAVLNWLDSLKQ